MYVISVIIPVFNESKTIKECLTSIFRQKIISAILKIEVIVVMDRCSVTTENIVKDFGRCYSNLKYLKSDKPGANSARNKGAYKAQGKILLFLDDDCVLADDNWLMRLWRKFQDYPQADAIGGGYILKDTNNFFNICQSKLTNFYLEMNKLTENETSALLGGNTAYRKEVFSCVACFDENIIYGSAETEFNERLLKNGKKLYHFKDISVYHLLDEKNTILKFLVKNFKRGRGRAYIEIKNGRLNKKFHSQNKKRWFVEIAKKIRSNLAYKLLVGMVLFFSSLFYWCGYIYGLVVYKIRGLLTHKDRSLHMLNKRFSEKSIRPFVSVIVPTFNRVKQLKRCIALLLAQDYPKERFEIIIVDDGSSDATETYLRQLGAVEKRIRYKTISNSGYSVVRNIGFRLAKGEIIVSLDDDCEVERDWLKNIILTFQLYPSATAVGGGIINPYNSLYSWAEHFLSFSKWLPIGRIRQMKDIPTCNIAYKKDQIEGFSFLEDGKSLYYRDSLFNLNLIKAGKKIFFNPSIKVFHYRPDSDTADNDFYEYQKRYASGFVHGGYKVHGCLGTIFFKYRFLNLFCPRLILLFLRCSRPSKYLTKFIKSFPLIFKGEWVRSKTIFLEIKRVQKN